MRRYFSLLILAFFTVSAFAQETSEPPKNWFNLDPVSDKINGISTEKAYNELLQGKESKTVLVAVIDSGIDIDHEDLKDIIWVNEDEIAGNGIDDDNNGFIDDVHGWNFIGGEEGNVDKETYELTREYKRLSSLYLGKTEKDVSRKERDEFAQWLEIKNEFEAKQNEAQGNYMMYNRIYTELERYNRLFKAYLNTDKIDYETIKEVTSNDVVIDMSKALLVNIWESIDESADMDLLVEDFKQYSDELEKDANFRYNLNFNSREIVGDDPSKLDEIGYGNNDVKGKDTDNFHGTHVAGIIAAKRGNDLGIDGVADNVRIMAVRAVPDGDERDKDVANAIRYAVDNGAQIINMSFGKGYSPHLEYVQEAIEYANAKGVLLVHAAGNAAENIDETNNFPNDRFGKKGRFPNWIEVGASSWEGTEDNFIGSFSNYGKKSVDVFAPGVAINSTKPGDEYENADGTSMASPVTAGMAALLLSYYPELSATQLKDIIMKSTRKLDGLKVTTPGTIDEQVNFSKLSVSGGIINAYEAVKLAESMRVNSKN
jgi:subtilisin family serine protease